MPGRPCCWSAFTAPSVPADPLLHEAPPLATLQDLLQGRAAPHLRQPGPPQAGARHRRGGRWGARGGVAGHAVEGQSTGQGWANPGQPVRALSPGLEAGAALLAGRVCGEPLAALCWGAKAEPHPQLLIQGACPPAGPSPGGWTRRHGRASVPRRRCRSALDRKQLLLPAHPEGLGGVFLPITRIIIPLVRSHSGDRETLISKRP